jgi:uridine kinase
VSPAESLRRARIRDLDLFGSETEVERRYLARYLPGQALYRREADPESRAHVVVDNERPGSPIVERWTVPGPE